MIRALSILAMLTAPVAAYAEQQPRGVDDPAAFVAATYARYQASPDEPPPDQEWAFSDRLRTLWDGYVAWARAHDGLVGALDFDWWTNAQDYRISNLVLTTREDGPDRRTITARFDNYNVHDEVRFAFVRADGRWYLDDAVQGSGHGGDGWTLSELLQTREE